MHSGNTIKFLAGNSHPELAQLIADRLGVNITPTTIGKFSNGETSVRVHESVRDEDVFVLQTACGPGCLVDDSLMELLVLISACKTASARRITAIIPFFPYSRYSFKDKSRAPITAKLVANMLAVAGCDHVITMDLHASQIQGFFDIPVDNLYSEPVMVGFIKRWVKGWKDAIVVSPDAGGAKRASSIADKLGIEFALIHRKRVRGKNGSIRGIEDEVEKMEILVGDVRGKIVILLDDMIDTGDTVSLATTTLHENGAEAIFVLVSHCTMQSNSATLRKLSALPIARLVVTNTLPQTHLMIAEEALEEGKNVKVLDDGSVVLESPTDQRGANNGTHTGTNTGTNTGSHTPRTPLETSNSNPFFNLSFQGLNLNGNGSINGVNGFRALSSKASTLSLSSTTSTSRNDLAESKRKFNSGVGSKLTVLDISPLLAESIRRTHNGESISLLFGDWAERAGFGH